MTDRPTNPYLVLAASIVPGAGHVLLGQAGRGLRWIFFMAILGWVSLRLMPPEATFFSRHVGGVFIYGLSILDSYKAARVKLAVWEAGLKKASLPENRLL